MSEERVTLTTGEAPVLNVGMPEVAYDFYITAPIKAVAMHHCGPLEITLETGEQIVIHEHNRKFNIVEMPAWMINGQSPHPKEATDEKPRA